MKHIHFAGLMLVLSGCVGTDVGNPPDDDRRIIATLEFEVYSSEEASPSALDHIANVSHAWISIDAVRVLNGDCDAPVETVVDGPFYVDLLNGAVFPEPPVIATSATEICKLKLDLGVAADDAPEPIRGLSVSIEGSDSDGEFVVSSSSGRVLPYRGENFEITAEHRFVDAFDISIWAETIRADDPINDNVPGAVAKFWTAMRDSSVIAEDADKDGKLSAEERKIVVGIPEQGADAP